MTEVFPADQAQPSSMLVEGHASSGQTLLVLGAGPKAIAIAAKRAALVKLGYPVPRLIVVDYQGVVAHWSGRFGFTDGRQLLGTRPEKDIGFPYASSCWGTDHVNKAIANKMLLLSWQSYLISEGKYSEWIDRSRTRPTHREWSNYLQWVAARVGLEVTNAEVRKITSSKDQKRWRLSCRSVVDNAELSLEGDGLVITGPGTPVRVPGQPALHPRIMDGSTFWTNIEEFARLRAASTTRLHIGVIGTGETAAAIVIALLDTLKETSFIEVINPYGVLYSRDEGFEENRLFSDPDARLFRLHGGHEHALKWSSLTESDRRDFVRRTDRGVFSLHAMEEVNRAENVTSVVGTARSIQATDECAFVDMEYDGKMERDQYDYVVVAIGFNALWFTALFDEDTRSRIDSATNSFERRATELAIDENLSVRNFEPRLHLPMLAGVAQGPGFPNLSCLGLLSDRILSSYRAKVR